MVEHLLNNGTSFKELTVEEIIQLITNETPF